MSGIEKMQRYIKNTGFYNVHYSLFVSEIVSLSELSKKDLFKSICLAFEYGQAKGYRAGRKGTKA